MKTPNTSDLFALGRILAMLNVKDDIKEIAQKQNEGKLSNSAFDVGYDLIMTILSKAVQKNVEKEIYTFLATVGECSANDLQDPSKFMGLIKEIIDSEEWRLLFRQAADLIIMK